MAFNREYDSRSAFLIHDTAKNIIIARNESDETPFKVRVCVSVSECVCAWMYVRVDAWL